MVLLEASCWYTECLILCMAQRDLLCAHFIHIRLCADLFTTLQLEKMTWATIINVLARTERAILWTLSSVESVQCHLTCTRNMHRLHHTENLGKYFTNPVQLRASIVFIRFTGIKHRACPHITGPAAAHIKCRILIP